MRAHDAGYSYAYFMRSMLMVFIYYTCFYICFFLTVYFSIMMTASAT